MGDSEHSVSRNLNRDLLRLKRRFSTGSVFVLMGKKTPALPPQKRTRLAGFSSSACLRPFSVPLCPGKLASADDIIRLPGSLQLVHTWPLDSSEKWWGRGVGWEWTGCPHGAEGSGSSYTSPVSLQGGPLPLAPAFGERPQSTGPPTSPAPLGPGMLMAFHCGRSHTTATPLAESRNSCAFLRVAPTKK